MEEGAQWKNKIDIPVIFVFFASVLALKWSTLAVPYLWDETDWVAGAFWLSRKNLFRVIPGFHPAGLFIYHPPVLHLSTGVLFKIFGRSILLSHLFIVFISFLGIYFTYLLGSFFYGRPSGIFAATFLLFTPLYFAQSGMFLGDLPVAALGVMCAYFAVRRLYIPYLICGIYLVLIKETSIAVVVSIAAYAYIEQRRSGQKSLNTMLKYAAPLAVLFSFFIIQKIETGKFCHLDAGVAQKSIFLGGLTPMVNAVSWVSKWMFFDQGRIWLTLLVILNLAIHKSSRRRKEHWLYFFMILIAVYSFSIIKFLPRYLLPALPYFCIVAGWSLTRLVPSAKVQTAVAALICVLFIRAFYERPLLGTSEWNMRYVEVVERHQKMCVRIANELPRSHIITSWPFTKQLSVPDLGYVLEPLSAIEFRHAKQIEKSDVIYWSEPPTDESDAIERYVLSHDLHAIGEVEGRPVRSGLFTASPQNP